jgi:hypothetical protein
VSFSQDYAGSARRHREAADLLHQIDHRHDIAGYLYGVAAECACKALMAKSGMRPKPELGRDDPFKCHFPALKTALREHAKGRRAEELRRFTDTRFLHEWDTDMRYAPRKDISVAQVERWKRDAETILRRMEEP